MEEIIKPKKYQYIIKPVGNELEVCFISPKYKWHRELTGKMRDVVLSFVDEDSFFQDDNPEATIGDYKYDEIKHSW